MLIVRGVGSGVVPYFLDGRHPGRWSEGAGRLLGVHGPPSAVELKRALEGRDPHTGGYLPARRPSRRRGGWDLAFSAPKSLSLLWAGLGRPDRAIVQAAHQAAVSDVMSHIEAGLTVRRRPDGQRKVADGLVAAEFDHTFNAAREPHLHTHVLLINLGRAGGIWGALESSWPVRRRSLAALYQLGLRHHLQRSGWELDWRLRPDGLADLADFPTSVIREASRQSRRVTRSGAYQARRWAQSAAATAASPAPPVAALGITLRRDDPPASAVQPDGAALARRVEVRLAGRRSDFRTADVLVALAASLPNGCRVDVALEWVDGFCRNMTPVPSPTSGPRWTTRGARRLDDELVRTLIGRFGGRLPPAGPAARTLTESNPPLVVLACGPGRSDLLGQAEVLAHCRTRWAAAGLSVAVDSPTAEGSLRWRILSGIAAAGPGVRPDVMVVDQADRRTSAELLRLAGRAQGQLILVEGGTMPRLTNPASHGLVEVADRLGRYRLPPFEAWRPGRPGTPERDRTYGRAAAEDLLARWDDDGREALMVGLGVEEVQGLNRAAVGDRPERGPGRYLPGDRVVVLRGGAGLPPGGTLGTVSEAGRGRSAILTIVWSGGRRSTLSTGAERARSGFGYSVTPALAVRSGGPLFMLGPAAAMGRARERVVAEVGGPAEPPRRDRVLEA